MVIAATFSFLLVPVLSAGAENLSCGGKNLLEQWKTENRAEYEQAFAEGNKVLNGKGIFWKIEKEGTDTSYLLGTMHLSDPRVLDIPIDAQDAQYDARILLLESNEILDIKKAMGHMLMKPELLMLPPGKRIEDFLTKEQTETLTEGLKARGIPLAAVNRFRPWMITSSIAVSRCELARKAKGAKVLDEQIALDAADYDIPVEGLETFEEQMTAMNSMSIDNQVKSLLATLALGNRAEDVAELMIELYEARNLGPFASLLLKGYSQDTSTATDGIYSEFANTMIIKRNHTMAKRATPHLAEGGAFIAVGALHLQGEEGLVELIRQQGYTVSAAE